MTLIEQALARGIRPPSEATLRKYGLTANGWLRMLRAQGWMCPICERKSVARWVTDHHHVPGWKTMEPAERRKHVRGVLCSWCNHRRVHSDIGAAEYERIARYARAHEDRRDR